MNIIGFTGHPSSGKDTAAEFLASKGFHHISMGDLIRDEMRVSNLPIDRDSVREYATKKRIERGPGYIAEQACLQVKENTVISGIRNASEAEVFRKKFAKEFTLIAVDAPIETRYKWALGRDRVGDDITFEHFKMQQETERASASQQVDAVIALADKVIVNDGTLEQLHKKVEECLV